MKRNRSLFFFPLLAFPLLAFPLLAFALLAFAMTPQAFAAEELPVKGMVTMVDLGATSCIPCKMMAPILEEVKAEYQGRAAVIFIDVWKAPEQGKKYQVRAIPTQLFYDRNGTEVSRHLGFMDKKAIVERLESLLRKK